MPSPLFGVEALLREPKGFDQQKASRKSDRLVRSGQPRADDNRPRKALTTRDGSRLTSADRSAAA